MVHCFHNREKKDVPHFYFVSAFSVKTNRFLKGIETRICSNLQWRQRLSCQSKEQCAKCWFEAVSGKIQSGSFKGRLEVSSSSRCPHSGSLCKAPATHLRSLLFPKQLLAVLVMETRAWSILKKLRVHQCTTRTLNEHYGEYEDSEHFVHLLCLYKSGKCSKDIA